MVRDGGVFAPTVLEEVNADMRVVSEEIFAPVMSIIPFDDIGEAIQWANASPFGLSAGLFTSNISTALRTARALSPAGARALQLGLRLAF